MHGQQTSKLKKNCYAKDIVALITIRKEIRKFLFIEVKAYLIIKFIHCENAEHEYF